MIKITDKLSKNELCLSLCKNAMTSRELLLDNEGKYGLILEDFICIRFLQSQIEKEIITYEKYHMNQKFQQIINLVASINMQLLCDDQNQIDIIMALICDFKQNTQ